MDTTGTLTTETVSSFSEVGSSAPDHAAKFLKLLAHRDRLKVLCVLLDVELSVAEIEENVGASQSATSQHLARLKDEGLVKSRRQGRQVLYSISDPSVYGIIEILYLRFCK